MTIIKAVREHEICAGHRVVGQGGKCENLHGHGYVFTFACEGRVNEVGMVIDFGVIKSTLCQWLEDSWDHKMILWLEDPMLHAVYNADPTGVVSVPFNPTAENMAQYLLEEIGPLLLADSNITLAAVKVQETRKCCATAEL